jgi:hypothetical protein
MVSDDHLDFATSMHVVRTWTQTCDPLQHQSFDNFKLFMSSIGLQDDTDETTQLDGFSMWKFRVVDAARWTLACIRYGF